MRTIEWGTAALLAIAAAACGDDSAAVGGGSDGVGGEGGESVGAGAGGGGEADCNGTQSDDPKFSQALDLLRETLAVNGIPGGAIAVIQAGQPTAIGVMGTKKADVCDPVTPDTLFVLPYMPIILTSIAALDAVEDDKLSLTEPINDIVPLNVESGAEYVDDITLHHLLTHSSMFTSASDLQPQNSTCVGLAEAFANAVDPAIEAAPGTFTDWEDRQNIELTALALETVDGSAFPDLLKARVLEPLGMGGTFDLATAQAADHATGYFGSGAEAPPWDCPNHYASYGYWGSVSDYAKLAEYLTGEGAAVLSPEMFGALNANQGQSFWSADYTTYWGAGWGAPAIGESMLTRGGGSWAGFNQQMFVFPDRGLAIIMMVNADQFVGERAVIEIAKIYGVDPAVEVWLETDPNQDPESLQTLAGTYVDPIGFGGSGPRTLEVMWDAGDPEVIEGIVSADGAAPQAVTFEGIYYWDNFFVNGGPVARFWRDEAGDPFGVSVQQYNGPPFYRVVK